MQMKTSLALLVCLAGASIISAQIINVEPGTDQISAAIQTAWPGDILDLAGGEYLETKTVMIPFALTIRGSQGATVTWQVPTSVKQGIHVKADFKIENYLLPQRLTDATGDGGLFGIRFEPPSGQQREGETRHRKGQSRPRSPD